MEYELHSDFVFASYMFQDHSTFEHSQLMFRIHSLANSSNHVSRQKAKETLSVADDELVPKLCVTK